MLGYEPQDGVSCEVIAEQQGQHPAVRAGAGGVSGTRGSAAPVRREGRYQATWKREFKLPCRKAGLLKSSQ